MDKLITLPLENPHTARTAWTFEDVPILFMPSADTSSMKKRPQRTPTDINAPRMKSIKEVIELTGLSEHYIRNLCRQNKIVYKRSGTKILINYDRLLDYLNNME